MVVKMVLSGGGATIDSPLESRSPTANPHKPDSIGRSGKGRRSRPETLSLAFSVTAAGTSDVGVLMEKRLSLQALFSAALDLKNQIRGRCENQFRPP